MTIFKQIGWVSQNTTQKSQAQLNRKLKESYAYDPLQDSSLGSYIYNVSVIQDDRQHKTCITPKVLWLPSLLGICRYHNSVSSSL